MTWGYGMRRVCWSYLWMGLRGKIVSGSVARCGPAKGLQMAKNEKAAYVEGGSAKDWENEIEKLRLKVVEQQQAVAAASKKLAAERKALKQIESSISEAEIRRDAALWRASQSGLNPDKPAEQ